MLLPGLAAAASPGSGAAGGEGVELGTAVLLAAASTVVLAALHLLAPRIRRHHLLSERATASFAGGLAVSYVFLHLLPELARGSVELREAMGESGTPSALTELAVFVIALLGFLLFYGLQRLAERSAPQRDSSGDGGGRAVFRVHLAAYVVYNGIITYTLPLNYRTGVAYAVLFTVAMALHFVLSDRALEEHYGRWFDRWPPRLLLAGALFAGWALAATFAPTRSLTVSLLIAFLAGSVLLNVFKEEIPSARRSSFVWFAIGLTLYAVLLGGVTALGAGEPT